MRSKLESEERCERPFLRRSSVVVAACEHPNAEPIPAVANAPQPRRPATQPLDAAVSPPRRGGNRELNPLTQNEWASSLRLPFVPSPPAKRLGWTASLSSTAGGGDQTCTSPRMTRCSMKELRSLPLVMQRPMDLLESNRGKAPRASLGQRTRHSYSSPYLTPAENIKMSRRLKEIAVLAASSRCPQQPMRDDDVSALSPNHESAKNDKLDTEQPSKEKQDVEEKGNASVEEHRVGALAEEYIRVLIKVEVDSRASIAIEEQQKHASLKKKSAACRKRAAELVSARGQVESREAGARRSILTEENNGFAALCEAAAADEASALSREEILPSCRTLIDAHSTYDVEPALCTCGAVVDLRWTGRADEVSLHCLAFGDDGKFINLCLPGESLRCPETGATIVHSWGEMRFSGTVARDGQEEGQRATFELQVQNLQPEQCPLKRFVFCVMNGHRTGASLSGLERAYLTIRVPESTRGRPKLCSTTQMREVVAVRLPQHLPDSALVVATVSWAPRHAKKTSHNRHSRRLSQVSSAISVKSGNGVGLLVVPHLKPYKSVLSYLRLPLLIEGSLFATNVYLFALHWREYSTICSEECTSREKLHRRFLIDANSVERLALGLSAKHERDDKEEDSLRLMTTIPGDPFHWIGHHHAEEEELDELHSTQQKHHSKPRNRGAVPSTNPRMQRTFSRVK